MIAPAIMDQELAGGEAENYRCGGERQVVFATSVKVRGG
jgi:hypothetical protein